MPNGLNRSKDCREMGPVAGRAISLYPKLEAFPSHQTASLPVPGRRQERVTGPGAAARRPRRGPPRFAKLTPIDTSAGAT
jgi:hypothetical protein